MNKLDKWLEDWGARRKDILEDDEGRKYILVNIESGAPREDYAVYFRKKYLPDELQNI